MGDNPLLKLQMLGQSVWLDYIHRQMINSGELRRLIENDGLRGVTSNPAIFEKAIAASRDYDYAIRALALAGKTTAEIYQALTVEDIQRAADLLRPVYDRLDGKDGFVSLEVNPHLAHDTTGTIEEARQLWGLLNRPNVFIKVPATLAGLPAIKQLISEGINVNVTLLFGLPRYRQVAEAFISGLEERAARGEPLEKVASVASFFLSRIDVLVDSLLKTIADSSGPQAGSAVALQGQVAIASAKVAYSLYQDIFESERFLTLAARGASPQRLLWASTSTKNPEYSDVKYVEPLIGPETINTMPPETIKAYRHHGQAAPGLEEGLDEAAGILHQLPESGIDLDQVTQQLEDEGVEKFNKPYDSLMATLEKKRAAALEEPVDSQMLYLGLDKQYVQQRIAALAGQDFGARLWRRDPSLWKTDPQAQMAIKGSLGWLDVAGKMMAVLPDLEAFVQEIREAGFRQVVHMGLGGSSLAPLALARILGPAAHGLPLMVLDTTSPATILEMEKQVPLAETLFIVASKSGTTAEPLAFGDYFYARVRDLKGGKAGENFVAITDRDTPLVQLAQERRFRRVFLNFSDIGGRYSALSYFGLAPAALLGLDVGELLVRALRIAHVCASRQTVSEGPGMVLGVVLGEMARRGRDKVTFLCPDTLVPLGMWLEQLLAESTGKEGTGILPVAGELVASPSLYGSDRLFISICLENEADKSMEQSIAALREAGHPVVAIQMGDRLDLGQEFFRWEIATATAGAVLGINPFDQPNVQESKNNTNRLLSVIRQTGRLPEDRPALVEGPLRVYGQDEASTLAKALTRFLNQRRPGDYVALLAYLPENAATDQALASIRRSLRDRLHLATTLGHGPRYLHSTGQLHKGGPDTGFFLLLTADNPDDVPIPGQPYTFGVFQQAQALGDFEALGQHGRRAMRIHLGADIALGLGLFRDAIKSALPRGIS